MRASLRSYTVNNAWAEGEEANKGSLSVGKLADFVVAERDLFAIPAVQLKEVKVCSQSLVDAWCMRRRRISDRCSRRTEEEVEHLGERGWLASQAAAQRGTLPAIHEQAGQSRGISVSRDVARLTRLFKTRARPLRDLRDALLDAESKDVVGA